MAAAEALATCSAAACLSLQRSALSTCLLDACFLSCPVLPWPAVVVDPIQSVKGKVVIDAFRCIRCGALFSVADVGSDNPQLCNAATAWQTDLQQVVCCSCLSWAAAGAA